mmetsp:Transcript_19228/g.49978  ORF Transcript_19228/g.49978 Transcript_19228/m.49978 type:complete len:89 (-) Transcript_19228:1235-1501(-)
MQARLLYCKYCGAGRAVSGEGLPVRQSSLSISGTDRLANCCTDTDHAISTVTLGPSPAPTYNDHHPSFSQVLSRTVCICGSIEAVWHH